MKTFSVISLLAASLFFSGCASKEFIGNGLSGMFSGKVTYFYRYSQLHTGIADKQKSAKCYVTVYSDENYPSLAVSSFPDSVFMHIDLAQFNQLPNGSAFYIVDQLVHFKPYYVEIYQNSKVSKNDSKGDGFIADNGTLTFSFAGVLPLHENGNVYNVPFEAYYMLKKMPEKKK